MPQPCCSGGSTTSQGRAALYKSPWLGLATSVGADKAALLPFMGLETAAGGAQIT